MILSRRDHDIMLDPMHATTPYHFISLSNDITTGWMTAVVFLKYAWGLVKKAAAYKSPTESEKDRTKTAEEQSAAVTQQLSEAIKNTDLTSGSEAWAK